MSNAPLVCIVDESAAYRWLMEHLMKTYLTQYSTAVFATEEALFDELPRLSQLPGLILLDCVGKLTVQAPFEGLSTAYETLRRLKAHATYQSIPVVMLSSEASADEVNAYYEAHANAFIFKAGDMDALHEQLQLVCHYWLNLSRLPEAFD